MKKKLETMFKKRRTDKPESGDPGVGDPEVDDPTTRDIGSGDPEPGDRESVDPETPDPDAPLEELVASDAEETGGPFEESATPDLAKEYLDQLQRLQAEFDNYRKRVSREKQIWWQQAKALSITGLLPVIDDYHRARQHAEENGEKPDPAGLVLILKRFEEVLTQLGLEEMKTEPGTAFDPEIHEAMMTAASDEIPEGQILMTLEPGYLLEGQMIRPGKVSVSSGPPPE